MTERVCARYSGSCSRAMMGKERVWNDGGESGVTGESVRKV